MKMIRGKYDSIWKQGYNARTGRFTGRLERGAFDTAMNYACKNKGGIQSIQLVRARPWITWRTL
jgi:hypothetical protein